MYKSKKFFDQKTEAWTNSNLISYELFGEHFLFRTKWIRTWWKKIIKILISFLKQHFVLKFLHLCVIKFHKSSSNIFQYWQKIKNFILQWSFYLLLSLEPGISQMKCFWLTQLLGFHLYCWFGSSSMQW